MENTNETVETEALQAQIRELESELYRTKADAEVNIAISMARPKNIAAAKVMLDTNGILNENGVDKKILNKNIAKLKEENPWLFENANSETKLYSSGLNFGFGASSDPANLSDEEYYKRIIK